MDKLRVAAMRIRTQSLKGPSEFARVTAANGYDAVRAGCDLVVFPGGWGDGLQLDVGDEVSADPPGLRLWELYLDAGARAARMAGTALVPGTIDLPLADERHATMAAVFGPDGTLWGQQQQTHRAAEDETLVAGETLEPVETPLGRLGLLLGADSRYPEAARILALKGVEVILLPLQPRRPYSAERALVGAWQIAQQNLVACVEAGRSDEGYEGRAAVTVPRSLSPDGSGFLPVAGYQVHDGALVADIPLEALRELRARDPLASRLAPVVYRQHLPGLYRRRSRP